MTAIRFVFLVCALALGCASPGSRHAADYDVILRGGRIVDGSGAPGFVADLGMRGDRVAAIGDLSAFRGAQEVDCRGLVVAPGFLNVLSWAVESLLIDPRGLSDLRQGVTLEVFGEGWSMGPLTESMVTEQLSLQGDLRYEIPWRTLGGYLEHLQTRGVGPNVASFVGATTVRMFVLGQDDRPPNADELARMQELVAQAMEEGALGVGSSLIYAPAFYADTDELIALMQTAAGYGGRYITHMRSEGNRLLEALDEVERIARAADCGAEIYHLKAAGRANWPKMEQVIARVEALRAEGLDITADMYTYTAGATGLDASMPPWVQEGGYQAWAERMEDPAVRTRVVAEMRAESDTWENLLLAAGSPDKVLLVSFKNPALKPYTGKSLAEVAALRGTSPEETAIDLVIEDGSRVGTVYFLMSEENVERQLALPWVSLGSDAGADAPEGVFLESNPHPRTYGNFARFLGHYVRERGVATLEEAVRRMTSLPADNFKLRERGRLVVGHFADVAVFDPATIQDHATFDAPHQLATGVHHVYVNGTRVLADSEPTGALPGRVVRGPGWTGN